MYGQSPTGGIFVFTGIRDAATVLKASAQPLLDDGIIITDIRAVSYTSKLHGQVTELEVSSKRELIRVAGT